MEELHSREGCGREFVPDNLPKCNLGQQKQQSRGETEEGVMNRRHPMPLWFPWIPLNLIGGF